MPATPFDTSGKSAALIQAADFLRRTGIHFTSSPAFRGGRKVSANIRFGAESGLKSDIASRLKNADFVAKIEKSNDARNLANSDFWTTSPL
jgi:hypothetical protein